MFDFRTQSFIRRPREGGNPRLPPPGRDTPEARPRTLGQPRKIRPFCGEGHTGPPLPVVGRRAGGHSGRCSPGPSPTGAQTRLDWKNAGMKTSKHDHDPPGVVTVPVEEVLDLHTYDPRELEPLLDDYLSEAHARGLKSVRIIHGKGRGVLRRRVRSLLWRHPLVSAFHDATPASGSWGATVVHLSPGKDDRGNIDTTGSAPPEPDRRPALLWSRLGVGLLLGIAIGGVLLWMIR